jgi:hypothetical protein
MGSCIARNLVPELGFLRTIHSARGKFGTQQSHETVMYEARKGQCRANSIKGNQMRSVTAANVSAKLRIIHRR